MDTRQLRGSNYNGSCPQFWSRVLSRRCIESIASLIFFDSSPSESRKRPELLLTEVYQILEDPTRAGRACQRVGFPADDPSQTDPAGASNPLVARVPEPSTALRPTWTPGSSTQRSATIAPLSISTGRASAASAHTICMTDKLFCQ